MHLDPSRARQRAAANRLLPLSAAAAAQLLELWLQRRAILGPDEVDHCLRLVYDVFLAARELHEGLHGDDELSEE